MINNVRIYRSFLAFLVCFINFVLLRN